MTINDSFYNDMTFEFTAMFNYQIRLQLGFIVKLRYIFHIPEEMIETSTFVSIEIRILGFALNVPKISMTLMPIFQIATKT